MSLDTLRVPRVGMNYAIIADNANPDLVGRTFDAKY